MNDLTEKKRRQIQKEFDRLSKKLDSEEGQRKVQIAVRRELRNAAKAHQAFLARSKARSRTRVVY